jgi:actin-related protein 5
MNDLNPIKNVNLLNQYKMHRSDYNKSDTLVIDNGTYELKGGYLGDKVSIKFQNCFYKDVEGLKYESIRGKNKYTPFTYDMISGLHVLEENIDQVLEYLNVDKCNNLIITDTVYSPTKKDLLKFLFEVYHFKKIQVGIDAIYSYLYNKGSDNGIIISLGHSSTVVYVIRDKKLKDVYKINYGGKFALTYLTNIVRYKYKECNKDCTNLVSELKCALDYDKEVFSIVERMKNWDYSDSVCISHEVEKEVVANDERRNRLIERLKNMNRKKKKIVEVSESEEIDEEEKGEEIDEEEEEKKEEEIDNEKSKSPGLYKMRCYQYNMRILKIFKRFNNLIVHNEEEYEKINDMPSFLNKKKLKYEQILRELELRDKCRKDSTNRKTYEFSLLLKTGELTAEEKEYKNKIKECEDTEIDEKLIKEKNDLLEIIKKYDTNYILEMSSVLDLVRGTHMKKNLLNIDLLRVSEVLFEPSLLGSDQMGLGEILENILSAYHDMEEVFMTGGFSQIKGLKERIEHECTKYGYGGKITVREAGDVVNDGFNGASFSDLFTTYTYEDYVDDKLD